MAADTTRDYALRPVIFVLVLVVVLGIGLRLYRLADESLWYDEGASLYLARYANLPDLFDQSKTTEAPLMAVFSRAWQGVLNLATDLPRTAAAHDFLIRLWPSFWSVLAIPLIFVTGRRLLRDEWAAVIAAALFAISPYHIFYAQEFRIYSFFTVVGLVALYAMLRALEENQRRYWLLMALAFTMMMYSHFIATFYIFAFNAAFVLMIPQYRQHFWRWTGWNALAMVLLAPALYLALGMNRMVGEIEYPWFPGPTAKTALITFKNWFAGYGLMPMAYWPLLALALLLFVLGLFHLRRDWRAMALILSLTFGPMVLGFIKWNLEEFSFYEHRIFTLSGATVLFGVAAGIRALPTVWGPRAGLAAVVALTIPCLGAYYQHVLHPIDEHRYGVTAKVDQRSAAAYIAANYAPGDMVAHASHFTIYAMKYYLPDAEHIRLGAYPGDGEVFVKTLGNEALLQRHGLMPEFVIDATTNVQRIWFLDAEGLTFEWEPTTVALLGWLGENFEETEKHPFNGLVLHLFESHAASANADSQAL